MPTVIKYKFCVPLWTSSWENWLAPLRLLDVCIYSSAPKASDCNIRGILYNIHAILFGTMLQDAIFLNFNYLEYIYFYTPTFYYVNISIHNSLCGFSQYSTHFSWLACYSWLIFAIPLNLEWDHQGSSGHCLSKVNLKKSFVSIFSGWPFPSNDNVSQIYPDGDVLALGPQLSCQTLWILKVRTLTISCTGSASKYSSWCQTYQW